MKHTIQLIGFILIIIGLIGLVSGEFIMERSSTRTLVFGAVDFVGLALISIAHWGMKKQS